MDSFWNDWQPGERATLCFVIKEGRVLLIHKKRGLGAGKINGPGGRIEPGESPLECAIRETHEELGIEVLDVHRRGELHFQFLDGYSLHCTVFVAGDLRGEPVETDEALPLWTSVEEIPYDRMWEDDRHWLPGVVEGGSFRGYFRFDGEKMLTHEVFWEQ